MEEASIKIVLKGIIKINYKKGRKWMNVFYYAEPEDPDCELKTVPDEESEEARWVSLDEFSKFEKIRSKEMIKYGKYIEQGGRIMPLDILNESKDFDM